ARTRRRRGRLLGRSGLDRDDDVVRLPDHLAAFRGFDVAEADRLAELKRLDDEGEGLRNAVRGSSKAELMEPELEHASTGDALRSADELDRDRQLDRLVGIDAREVDVHDLRAERIVLHFLDDAVLLPAIELDLRHAM